MEKNRLLSSSIIILAVCIVFGSVYIGNSIKEVTNQKTEVASQVKDDVLDLDGAAEYLNIEKSELITLIANKDTDINYVKIKGKYIFSKEALRVWVLTSRLEVN